MSNLGSSNVPLTTTAFNAAATTTDKAEKPKSKGGRGARSKRTDKRRQQINTYEGKAITSEYSLELGLHESSLLATLKPAASNRPTGVHVNLIGSNQCVTRMLLRARAVAQRPLALLLTPENLLVYRRVASFVLTSRVACSQVNVPFIYGNPLELQYELTTDEVRQVDGRTETIPNFFAWILVNIGKFIHQGQDVIPLLPNPDTPNIVTAMSGSDYQISSYVQLHRAGQPGVDINPEDLDNLAVLQANYPNLMLNAQRTRFTANSAAFWIGRPTPDQWDIFVNINAAMREQQLTVSSFRLSTATGSPAPMVRFPILGDLFAVNSYYVTEEVTMIILRTAIVLRLGIDQYLTPQQLRQRFIGDPNTAFTTGNDTPDVFISAQVSMLSRHSLTEKSN